MNMELIIKYFLAIVAGIMLGYAWAFYHFGPGM
jgi:hypothetical protein